MSILLPPQCLAAVLRETTRTARASGALWPIRTQATVMEEDGIPYCVRCLQPQEYGHPGFRPQDPGLDPFLPPDPALFVADISPTHIAVLNKFSVVDDHMLIITRRFVPQEAPLALDDFRALHACMVQVRGLGFYNSGPRAGASQRHRHLQLVPLPLSPTGPSLPTEHIIRGHTCLPGVTTVAALPFVHRLSCWETTLPAPETLASTYAELRDALGLQADDAANLLVTDGWMMVVPRCAESWRTISVNALGFAGALLVRSPAQLEQLRAVGPGALLRAVTGEPHPHP